MRPVEHGIFSSDEARQLQHRNFGASCPPIQKVRRRPYSGVVTRTSGRSGSPLAQLLETPRDRALLGAVGLSAVLGSFAETMVLLVVSLAGFRLAGSGATAVALPAGLYFDELSTGRLVVVGLGLVVIRLLMLLVNAVISTKLSARVAFRIRERLIVAYHVASYQRILSEPDGHLQAMIQVHATNAAKVVGQIAAGVTAGTSLAVFGVAAVLVNPIAAAALLVFGLSMAVLLRPLAGYTRSVGRRQTSHTSEFARLLSEASSSFLEQRVFGVTRSASRLVNEELVSLTSAERKTDFVYKVTPLLYSSFGFGAILLGIASADRLELGEVAAVGAVVLLMIRSMGHGQVIQVTTQNLAGARGFLEDLFRSVEDYEFSAETFGDESLETISTLSLEDATLGYGNSVVLKDVNLFLRHGESVGIIGPSGAGKSTLVAALLRLIPVQSGSYRVNKTNATEICAESWHRLIGFVPQDATLIEGSVADNIRFYREDLSKERLHEAAVAAHLGRELADWADGLDHQVGPGGNRMSGGQRQRICIARALVADPELVFLDEPTSALDAESEAAVTQVLSDLRGTKSLVIVAHRLTTLAFCDRVVLVDEGGILEVGSGADVKDRAELRELAERALGSDERS